MRARVTIAATLLLCVTPLAHAAPPPVAARHPVADRYFNRPVTDDYRWLEDGAADTVRAWSDAENAATREWLDALPDRLAVLKRITALSDQAEASYRGIRYAGGWYFVSKDQPPRQQPSVVRLQSLDDPALQNTVVDPMAVDSTGRTAIDFFVPSLDGRHVAVSLSRSGSESGGVRVFDAATGVALPDRVPGVNGGTAGGGVAWNADGTGFYRTRYPQPGERPAADLPFYLQVYFHTLGTDASQDRYVVGKEFPRIAEIRMQTARDGALSLLDVSNGDGGAHMFWIIENGVARQFTAFGDSVANIEIGDDALYLLSRHQAPNGAVLRVPLPVPEFAAAKLIIPEAGYSITGVTATPGRLYLHYIDGGPSKLRSFTHEGKPLGEIPLPEVTAASQPLRTGGEQVLVQIESYTQPARWLRWDDTNRRMMPTAIENRSPVSFAGIEVERRFAISKDGTRVSPWHSRKMIARLQAANASANPILLRTTSTTGHGMGTPRSERNLLSADIYAFLFHELGVKYRAVEIAQ